MKTVAIIPAAGVGKRMGLQRGKPFLLLGGRPILVHTLEVFEKEKEISEIILVVSPEELEYSAEEIVEKYKLNKVKRIVPGGKERQDSVYNGFKAIRNPVKYVMIHDGVRPFVTGRLLRGSIEMAKTKGGVVVAVPVKDTIKKVSKEGIIEETLERRNLWAIQSPQVFKYEIINKAYLKAYQDEFYGTDDASLVERIGHKVEVLMGSYENIKITTQEDLVLAEMILRGRERNL